MKKLVNNLKYYMWAFIMALAFTLSACSTLDSTLDSVDTENQNVRILIQYSVLKASEESESINRASILAVTNKIKSVLDNESENESVTLAYISTEIKDYISYNALMPSDRLLVDALMLNIQSVIQDRIEVDVIDADAKKKVLEVIELIEQAAIMAD